MMIKKLVAWTLSAAMVSSMLPAPVLAAEANSEQTLESVIQTVTASPEIDLPSNDELFALYAEQVLYGYEMATFGTTAGSQLKGNDLLAYEKLKTAIQDIASGTATSTSFCLGYSGKYTSDGKTYEPKIEVNFGAGGFDGKAVVSALLSDCPYELYWYDKTAGTQMNTIRNGDSTIVCVQFDFAVAGDYAAVGETYKTDKTKTEAAATAAAKANTVVADNASKTPYERLVAYKEYICGAVSYNTGAANNSNTPYGNPWQLIYVFDGNGDTNVVCEGYSKAFQYLCDLDADAASFQCASPTGYMGTDGGTGGRHMWNVVSLENPNYSDSGDPNVPKYLNYMVDVTNCDEASEDGKVSVGYPDLLFLKGAARNSYTGGAYKDDDEVSYEYLYNFAGYGNSTVQYYCHDLGIAATGYTTTYPVTIITPKNGTVTADKSVAGVGETVTLTVTPNEGYVLDSLTVKQGETNVEVTDHKFTMPEGGVTVTATFKEHTHALTYAVDGATITATCSCGNPGSVTLTAAGKTYDGSAFVATVDKTGTLADADVTVTYKKGETTLADAPKDAGDYTASITVDGETVTADFTIAKAPLTITADAKTKTYGESDPELTYKVTTNGTLYTGNALTGALSRVAGDNVGTYAIEQGNLTANGNYTIIYVPANLTISAKEIEIASASIADLMYDADGSYNLNVTGVTFSGLVGNETLSPGTGYDVEAKLADGFVNQVGKADAIVTVTLKNRNYTLKSATYPTKVNIVDHAHDWSFSDNATGDATITATCYGTIGTCPVENQTVTLTLREPANLTYDGKAKTVIVEQSVPGAVTGLPEVTYTGAVINGEAINASDYTATLKMSEGVEAAISFTIEQKNITNAPVVFDEMTYIGQSQTPTATVTIDGLTVSGTWAEVTDVGQESTFTPTDGTFTGTLTKDPGMKKATPVVTAPVAVENLTYEINTSYDLVAAGFTTGGELQYSLDENGTYGATIPVGTNAGTYTVWYKVVGDNNYADVAAQSVSVTIASKHEQNTNKSSRIFFFKVPNVWQFERSGICYCPFMTQKIPELTPEVIDNFTFSIYTKHKESAARNGQPL